jgi:hypothetical protein
MMSTKKTIEGLFVPGLWECAECDFTLLQQVMSAADGSVAPDDRPGGACPNCECLLHRVSWRTSAETLETRLITAIDEIRELEAKVQELTRLLLGPATERRQWYIAHLLKTQGHFRRLDIMETFGVTFPTVSADIARFIEANPGAMQRSLSNRRYEATPA